WVRDGTLVSADPKRELRAYERALAVSGDRAIVGADIVGQGQGALIVFERDKDGWHQREVIDFTEGTWTFVTSIAFDGDGFVAGLAGDGLGGSVRSYRRDNGTWREAQRLAPQGLRDDAAFGWSLAVSGNLLLVGAPDQYIGQSSKAGAAYVYTRSP
ncbi:MAG TPA: hypothetical protein VNO21_00780, partial [Polyangiaceae bacterium]|nr:hypothetical protein [Polyangiaceae bacterium]